jgi:uncharacterized OB-fold protein
MAYCKECGIIFIPINSQQTFCCKAHRKNHNARVKYWRDKRDHPERAERHRKRRYDNRRAWGERMVANGLCNRCGKNKLTDNKLCGFCHRDLKLNCINIGRE